MCVKPQRSLFETCLHHWTISLCRDYHNLTFERSWAVFWYSCIWITCYFFIIVFQSPYRTVLKDTAIPTIFDLTSHLKNPHSRHRKRIKELVYLLFFARTLYTSVASKRNIFVDYYWLHFCRSVFIVIVNCLIINIVLCFK